MDRGRIRSEWEARPPTVRLFVVGSLLGFVFATVRDPGTFSFPRILFAAVAFGLLKKLWDGERGVWWLFVIATATTLAVSLPVAFDDPAVRLAVAAETLALMLLVSDATRSFVARRTGAPVP